MERFTYKHNDEWCVNGVNGKISSDNQANYWGEAINRLAEYEDLEEDGRLIRLPCKIGDKVYNKNWNWSGTVGEISINSDGVFLYVTSGGYNHLVKQDEIEFE